ncbi:hypothetical protein ACFGVS_04315 [Mucilaginibacter sp. AW1-7]|jgi:hypothetical protein|uniref:hypothetical protein n=1 Tax=unclassified Mucilaginibacter TaxID=2617802 RepID=UPI0023650BA3|nr:hypothetical protein [Mucilaginibacter sp. KACC 22773]WDF80957.1 hypothetical protein PQ469_13175 [Mucilaginibacter sp. KACC 22773]
MKSDNLVLVFVHGWSVTNLNTYGELPLRLMNEASSIAPTVTVKDIYLGQYVSFHDEVQLHDISRAFEHAVREQLSAEILANNRFVCITHSTGGPVVREWFDFYYNKPGAPVCPMSHLIMLAPANFGSALAQLGKSKISRLKSWFEKVEPGQGVLNWLELGSDKSWDLNEKWIKGKGGEIGENGIFPFSIIGQSIDRAFYDNLNSYTGELGSDGVVRSAAANLNATYVSVKQGPVVNTDGKDTPEAMTVEFDTAPKTAFRVVKWKAHSGTTMGIMASPKEDGKDDSAESAALIEAILDCIKVNNINDYDTLIDAFAAQTDEVQAVEQVEKVSEGFFLHDRYFIHDRFSMVIFRIHDSEDYPVTDYDLIFTAGDNADPNHLPEGFFADRQRNSISPQTVTYFVNHDVMNGCAGIKYDGKELRPALPGAKKLGLIVNPRPDNGFIKYVPFEINAADEFLKKVIQPNSTTLIDICLQRVVSQQVFGLIQYDGPMPYNHDFSDLDAGTDYVN